MPVGWLAKFYPDQIKKEEIEKALLFRKSRWVERD